MEADERELAEDGDRPRRVLSVTDLLEGEREVWIQHGTDMYRLMLTRNGKLLLQK